MTQVLHEIAALSSKARNDNARFYETLNPSARFALEG